MANALSGHVFSRFHAHAKPWAWHAGRYLPDSQSGVPLSDVEDLVRKVRDIQVIPPHPNKMLVVGDGRASHRTMAVLDAGHDAGLERVRMAVTG